MVDGWVLPSAQSHIEVVVVYNVQAASAAAARPAASS